MKRSLDLPLTIRPVVGMDDYPLSPEARYPVALDQS